MITQGTKACLLNDGDEVLATDGRIKLSDVRMVMAEGIITFAATKVKCGTLTKRWAAMNSVFNKVIED